MKVKTSITLSEDLLKVIDEQARPGKTRSEFIEQAIWAYIEQTLRDQRNARDLEILNRRTEYLNQEAEDVLAYQVAL